MANEPAPLTPTTLGAYQALGTDPLSPPLATRPCGMLTPGLNMISVNIPGQLLCRADAVMVIKGRDEADCVDEVNEYIMERVL